MILNMKKNMSYLKSSQYKPTKNLKLFKENL